MRLTLELGRLPVLALNAADVTVLAELAPVIEGKPDVSQIREIDLLTLGRRFRAQQIVFATASNVFDQIQPDWPGSREQLLAQLVRLVEQVVTSDRWTCWTFSKSMREPERGVGLEYARHVNPRRRVGTLRRGSDGCLRKGQRGMHSSPQQQLSRRALLTVAASVGGGAVLLAACGGGGAAVTASAPASTSATTSATVSAATVTAQATSTVATTAAATTTTSSSAALTTSVATTTATATQTATSSAVSSSTAASAAVTATTSSAETAYVANAGKSGVPVTVLDAWGTGPWEKQLYDGWTQGIAKALPNLKVEFIMTGGFTGGSTAKTLAMIAAGTPPDLTLGSDVSFALKEALVDLKPYFDQDKEIGGWKWYPPCWQLVNIVLDNGHPMLWAFPGNSDARVIYLNLDLLQKVGITYDPAKQWDWPTFEDAAKRLTKRQPDGTIQQLGFSGLWTFGDPYVLAQYAGGNFFAIDKTSGWVNKATFSAPGTQQGLDFYRKLMVEDKVSQLPNEKFSGGFTAGTVAMTPSWTSFLSSLNPTTNPKLQQFKWDVAGFPVMKAGDKWPNQFANGSQMGSLVQGSKNLTGAYQVGKYLIGDGHVVRMQAMGAPPIVINNNQQQQVWKQRAAGTRYTATYDAAMSQGSIGTWSKIKSNSDQIMKLYGDNITKLLNGQLAVSDFGAAMDGSVNPLLQSS